MSPRKLLGQSDKGSTSPAHVTTTNPSKGKGSESSETSGGGTLNQAAGSAAVPASTAGVGQDEGDNDAWRGTMPPKIEEGDEPPHPNVLPA